jgi:hypothetical protein
LRRFSAFFASVTLGAQAAFILLKLWNSKAAAAEWEHVSSDASLRKAPDLSLATSRTNFRTAAFSILSLDLAEVDMIGGDL